jgi:hypothetical protein
MIKNSSANNFFNSMPIEKSIDNKIKIKTKEGNSISNKENQQNVIIKSKDTYKKSVKKLIN